MHFKQEGTISNLGSKPLKLVDPFFYHGSNILSTESDVNVRIVKAWTDIDRSITWKSDLTDKTKRDFFKAMAESVLLYRCTLSTLRFR